ncbi:MAG: helix-hairpin-helix domain-containing protein [Candidatus Marinimicrobia bacterium]|nr:helix-hairpin-helix domain-containing protein [Candidatus Neomarinimicrobiota bacterium]
MKDRLHKIAALLLLQGVFALSAIAAEQIDINNASLSDLASLPLSVEQVEAVYEYVQYQGPLESIYELVNVKELSNEDFQNLKRALVIKPDENASSNTRLEDQYRKVENWTSTEGASEGLMELWLERLAEPMNVNTASYEDLVSLQNVSPVDAVAVMKLRAESGSIGSARWLRNAIGLSYYGYQNMRDFITYDEAESGQWHIWYNMVMKTIPSTNATDEEATNPLLGVGSAPDILHKFSFSNSTHWKAGFSYNRQFGEANRYFKGTDIPEVKASLTLSDYNLGGFHLDRLVLGNFSATFSQGLIFESTDFRSPRRSGYGWNKRVHGIFSDLSRSQEYAQRGVGIQGSLYSKLKFIGFVSKNDRDAVLNPDGESFTSLITLYPRTDTGLITELSQPLLDVVDEVTYGGNLRYELFTGTFLGVSAYESLYDKELNPQPTLSIIHTDNTGLFLNSSGNGGDTEIAALHASSAQSNLWKDARANRRIQGLEFSTVIKNLAFQVEWAYLDKDSVGSIDNEAYNVAIKDEPQALVANAFLQFDNLNFMVLYRDYDLAYDNPYQRSFSNYQRYKSSIYEDEFYLKDPVLSYLYTGASQPQAERGVYISSRYQIHRAWVMTANFDTWTRVADGSRYYRTVATAEFRPTFNYRINIRQKWQARGSFNIFSPTGYENRETIIRARMRLSGFDQLQVTYVNSATLFDPRRRLTIDLASGVSNVSPVGQAASPGNALGFVLTHNFTPMFKLIGSVVYYKGFFWSFEDTDFRVFDSPDGSIRWWLTGFSRIGNHWAVRAKLSWDEGSALSNYAYGLAPYDPRVLDKGTTWFGEAVDFRLQLDYAF